MKKQILLILYTLFIQVCASYGSYATQINLAGQDITDRTLQANLEPYRGNGSEVNVINLNFNYLTDRGAETLVSVIEEDFPQLKELYVCHNNITAKGLPYFRSLLDKKSFKLLVIVGNKASTTYGIKQIIKGLQQEIKNLYRGKLIWTKEKDLKDLEDHYLYPKQFIQFHQEFYERNLHRLNPRILDVNPTA